MNEDDLYFKQLSTCEVKTEDSWTALGFDVMDDDFKMVIYEGRDEDGDEVWS